MENNLDHLFEKNREWAASIKESNPEFFSDSSKGQAPEILWIGCSDSRVSANQMLGLMPGEVFVHRNIANVVVHTDLNCLSVMQYAVDVLKVKHIIVCGHYGCGGVNAAMSDESFGIIDNWLSHIKDVKRLNQAELDGLEGDEKHRRMCELNVIEQVANVAQTPIVKQAWQRNQELSVHGWVYDLEDGLAKNLNATRSS